jgi:hypothetical protein
MSDNEQKGVLIGSDAAFVHLIRVSEWRPDDGMVTAVIRVKAGPFTGTVQDSSFGGVACFCEKLQSIYDTLSGCATLQGYESFTLTAKGNGRGQIDVSVEVVAEYVPRIELIFEMILDQTYLPGIIKGLRREFPEG